MTAGQTTGGKSPHEIKVAARRTPLGGLLRWRGRSARSLAVLLRGASIAPRAAPLVAAPADKLSSG